jgi:hypothetical protein
MPAILVIPPKSASPVQEAEGLLIRKKSVHYPPAQKKGLTLALDSARTPSHTFQRVLDVFRAEHLEECKQAGFEQVWAVGPRDELVVRLDA